MQCRLETARASKANSHPPTYPSRGGELRTGPPPKLKPSPIYESRQSGSGLQDISSHSPPAPSSGTGERIAIHYLL